MKFWFAGLLLLCLASTAEARDTLRLAVTTSFHNSGLADVLLPMIADDLDLEVQLLVVGTGQALALGRAGDVDAILVHSPAAEEQFVAEGAGTHRRELMYNDFVIVGPAGDPAGISGVESAVAALRRIGVSEAAFVSRGDDSGTHRKELALWKSAGLNPETFPNWYRAVGAGMGAALNIAVGMGAYVLADRASWLNFENRADFAILYAGDPALHNQYAFLPVNPERHPHVKSDLAARLEQWLLSDQAKSLIDGYRINGQPLFVFNGR